MLTNRIPLIALQTALFEALTKYQDKPVYDDVVDNAETGYITLGAMTVKPNGAKVVDISDCSVQIHLWSNYYGKQEINEMANDVISIIAAVPLDLVNDGFTCLSQDIDFFEAYPEDQAGYHGVITLITRIQNTKQK